MKVRFGQIFTCEHCGIEMIDSTLMNQHEKECNSISKEKKISEEKIAEAKYWVFVDEVQWNEKYGEKGYLEKVRKELNSDKNKDELYKIYKNLKSDLYKVLDNYLDEKDKQSKWPLGDDSTDDFLSHICGESKNSYYEYFNNPEKMLKRAIKEGYLSKSFDYIWLD